MQNKILDTILQRSVRELNQTPDNYFYNLCLESVTIGCLVFARVYLLKQAGF